MDKVKTDWTALKNALQLNMIQSLSNRYIVKIEPCNSVTGSKDLIDIILKTVEATIGFRQPKLHGNSYKYNKHENTQCLLFELYSYFTEALETMNVYYEINNNLNKRDEIDECLDSIEHLFNIINIEVNTKDDFLTAFEEIQELFDSYMSITKFDNSEQWYKQNKVPFSTKHIWGERCFEDRHYVNLDYSYNIERLFRFSEYFTNIVEKLKKQPW